MMYFDAVIIGWAESYVLIDIEIDALSIVKQNKIRSKYSIGMKKKC